MKTYRYGLARLTAATAIVSLLGTPFVALAAPFNPNHILDDAAMRRSDAMSYLEIRTFLASKGGLGDVLDIDPNDGLLKNGAQLVADAAKRYSVNPQYILALIQKESSAVESDKPDTRQLEWATGYALCDGCYRDSSSAQKYRGFAKQVDAGAGWINWYYENASAGTALRQPGNATDISGMVVVPDNIATAALYSYTPHLHGNLLLWNIWNRWFGDGTVNLDLPSGTLVRDAKTGATALVQGGKFRSITNASVLATRFSGLIPVDLSHGVFEGYMQAKAGRPIRFSDYSLVRVENGTIYLLVGDKKRRIVSMTAFGQIGFNPEEVEDGTAADLEDYEDGEPITGDQTKLLGELQQNATTGGVYYVEGDVKHPLLDRALLTTNFSGEGMRRVTPAALNALPTGQPVLFANGVLVKEAGSPAVYVISDGTKLLIPSEDVFLAMGYRWQSIVTTTKKLLDAHPVGTPLSLTSLLGGGQK